MREVETGTSRSIAGSDAIALSPKSRGLASDTFHRIRKNPGALAGLIVLIAIILSAIFAPVVAPNDPIEQNTQAIRQGPSRDHIFGTDTFGRDVFSRVVYGGRHSLPVGLIAVGIAGVIGVITGLAAGYYGRWIDTITMRIVDMMLAFPGILFAMSIVAILGTSLFNL
ncbi:MAG: ABC transporter permease, partial [Thermomicrobiales bacterium]